jgi:hypothetical protein
MRLLLTREEINARAREGVHNARTWSEMTAALAWARIHRQHPWRGFFLDLLGSLAMAGAIGFSLNVRR